MDDLTYSQLDIFETVNLVFICSIICVFGVAANVINSIAFFKQGFTNTVNISFFGLRISDMCCLITMLWVCLFLNPFVKSVSVPWVAEDFVYLTGGWPHVAFGRITSYITVFISAERCLCITMPLKVKEIVTPTRTAFVVSLIYILNIIPLIPEYSTSYFEFQYIDRFNRTLLVIAFTSSREEMVGLVFFLSSVTGAGSFVAVIVVTLILVIKLKQSSKWRQGATSSIDHKALCFNREKKTVKMVAIIATILIVCYIPGSVIALATFIEPELNLRGRYAHLADSMWTTAFVFQTFNSSVNIFLYYKMSSKYRQTFDEMMGRCRRSA